MNETYAGATGLNRANRVLGAEADAPRNRDAGDNDLCS